jgi:DNA-binding NarL/FixJ family response regulator
LHKHRLLDDEEAVAIAFRTWRRLVEQGKESVAYATPLAQYAIRQVRAGRRIGSAQNRLDILSRQAQRTHGFSVESIHRQSTQRGVWDDLLVEDRQAGPAETAAARMDEQTWLKQLSKRDQGIARDLALGETTGAVAKKFKLSDGRISQLRRWLSEQWEQFQGEVGLAGCTA